MTKIQRGRRKWIDLHYKSIFLPNQPLHILRFCFPQSVWTLFVDGNRELFFFFLLPSCDHGFLFHWITPILNSQVFFIVFYSPCPAEEEKWESALVQISHLLVFKHNSWTINFLNTWLIYSDVWSGLRELQQNSLLGSFRFVWDRLLHSYTVECSSPPL